MSLLNLLSLDDELIDTVTTVVRTWCNVHQVPLESRRGQDALEEAIRIVRAGERSEVILADKLSDRMWSNQFLHPTKS